MSDIKSTIVVAVDGTGVETGVNTIKRSLAGLGQAAAATGGQVGDALGGAQAEAGAKRTEAAVVATTRTINAFVSQASRTLEKLSADGNAAVELQLAAIRKGIPENVYAPYVANIQKARDAQALLAESAKNTGDTIARTVTPRLNEMGLTAGQISNSLRQVPAQFTDIVVSLASGQQPLTVMLQQGGQLKDMFGGVGNAIRAIGGYALGLLNPFTIAAAGVGALAYAAYSASEDAKALSNALTLTGNKAGTTASNLNAIAASLSGAGVGASTATAALVEFVNAGVKADDRLQNFVKNAVELERVGGPAAAETAKAFAALSKDPLASLDKLTLATYKQIEALLEQGDKIGAVKVAQDALNQSNEDLAKGLRATNDPLDNTIAKYKQWGAEAWNVARGLASTIAGAFSPLTGDQERAKIQYERDWRFTNGYDTTEHDARLDYFKRLDAAQKQSISNDQTDIRLRNLKAEFDKNDDSTKRLRERNKLIADNTELLKAGEITQKQYNTTLKAFDAKGAKTQPKEQVSEHQRALASYVAALQRQLDKEQELTEVQKAQNFLKGLGKDGQIKQTQELVLGIAAQIDAEKALDAINKSAAKTLQERAKGVAAFEKERAASLRSAGNEVSTLEARAQAAEDEVTAYGLGKEALADLTIARLEDQKTVLQGFDGSAETIDLIEREISARKRLAQAGDTLAAKKEADKAAQKAADEWKRAAEQIENSITDALMRGFESGKGFAENLRDTVVNMFKTMVLRPVVEMGVRGSLSVLGLGGASGAASAAETAGNSLSTLSSLSGITNWLTDFGSAGASAIIKGGQIAYNAGFETIGRSMMSLSEAGNFSAVANGLNAVGNGLGYLNAAMAASKGQWGRAAGSAIGTWFGGPIGGAIGNAVGGWVDESFSGGHEYTTGTGIAGKFSGNQFAGRNYQDWRNDGSSGFFGIGASGSSSGTNYSALDSRQAKFMGAAYGAIITQTADFASALGASASTITGYQKDIKLALGSDAEANKKAIADLFKGLADEVAATVLDGQYIREGEGAADTLARLATNLAAVNGALGTLGGALLAVGQSGGDMASSLVDLFGGLSQYQSAIGAYYQAFYSLDEQRTQALANLIVSLNDAGIALPASRDAYRALVDAQDLATESGRKTYATLIGLSGAFASVTAATDAAMKSFVADGAKLQVDLLTAQGDSVGAQAAQRAIAIAGLGDAAVAQYDYNQSLRDQISAANAAAAAAQNFVSALGSIAATRQSLEAQLLGAQGDTVGALALTRKNELASLTQGLGADDAAKITAAQQYNYALEDQITALQNAKTAAEASARAQEEASRASDQLRQAWQSVTDSIFGEVKRIRDLMGGNSAQSYAQAQARFSITAAQASAGDQEAAKLLPSLSQALLTLAEAQATSLLQLRAIQGQTAGTLERIGGNYTAQYGLTVPKLATGTNYVPQDMLALIHQGEAVVPARYNPATGGGDNAQLVAEIQALRVAVAALQKAADTTADATSTTSKTLLNVTLGGVAMQTEAV